MSIREFISRQEVLDLMMKRGEDIRVPYEPATASRNTSSSGEGVWSVVFKSDGHTKVYPETTEEGGDPYNFVGLFAEDGREGWWATFDSANETQAAALRKCLAPLGGEAAKVVATEVTGSAFLCLPC